MIPAHSLAESHDQVFFPTISHDEPYEVVFHDETVKLYLDPADFDFHLDASSRALPSTVECYLNYARRLGFMPMPADECPPEVQDDGYVRLYLVPIEPVSDIRWEMPSLVETGMGPYSMEIPAIPRDMTGLYGGMEDTGPIPTVIEPEPDRFEIDWRGRERRVGRHRAQP